MDAFDVLTLIDKIGATSSRTEKETFLAQFASTELGGFVLKWAYSPFITYGLTPSPTPSDHTLNVEFQIDLVKPLLERLAHRTLTGNAAIEEVNQVMAAFDDTGARLLFLILSKDLKCGIAAATINAVLPGLVPVFAVMRANKFEEKRIKTWPVMVEPKIDGFRYTFLCRDGQGAFFTRNGNRASAVDHLVEPMIELALKALGQGSRALGSTLSTRPGDLARYARDDLNFMVDGEMVAGSFKETSGALKREGEEASNAKFNIFDLMSFKDFDAVGSVGLPYVDRRKLVEEFVAFSEGSTWGESSPFTKTPAYYANSVEEVHTLYDSFQARGLEGAMVKTLLGLYDKKKSSNWLKMKSEETEDLPIVGFFNGEANTKYEHLMGGVIVDRGGVMVRVGGGWTDEQREELNELWKQDAATVGINPIVGFKPGKVIGHVTGCKLLGRLLEVLYNEVTPDGSLRHPRAVRFRDDKAGELESKEAA